MVSQELFHALDKREYESNMGRIKDVTDLNAALNAITTEHTSEALIKFFTSITVRVSTINSMEYTAQRYFRDSRFLLNGGGTHEVLQCNNAVWAGL